MISPRMRNWVVGVVTFVWLSNFVAVLIPQLKYEPDPTIHAVFMAVVGGLVALGAKDKNSNGDKKNGTG